MLPYELFPWLLLVLLSFSTSSLARSPPHAMRISCGAHEDIHTPPTNTLWYKDFGYTGGIPTNAAPRHSISPPLQTIRYFPLSEGSENCYIINKVPVGHYLVRIFFGLVVQSTFDNEPLFDTSIEGTQICSLKSGWSSHDEQGFAEAIVFLTDSTASICFHSTGHGDPAILAIEILQVDDKAYYFGPHWRGETILRTITRLSCGTGKPKFDQDYNGDLWGGGRFWNSMQTFSLGSDQKRSTEESIKQASLSPNFYPKGLYQTAIVGTDKQPDLEYTINVDPKKNYSVWLHFAEIDVSVTDVGERVFDVLINGDTVFQHIDIIHMSGDRNAALVLNTTVAVSGRTLTITFQPKEGNVAIVNAIEVFEIVFSESKTSADEVEVLKTLKDALGLPMHLGWNGDPCVPQQHPWIGVSCHLDSYSSKWVIDGLGLDNQGLRGTLPSETSKLHHLLSINLSGNSISGPIPSSLGTISSLQIVDLSYNFFSGSIPDTLVRLLSLKRLNLNGNSLSGRVPAALGARLLHGASFNFTDNHGLCGIPGLPTCGPHLSAGAKVGIAFGSCVGLLFLGGCVMIWWKRRQNILRVKQVTARKAPYATLKTHFSHDIQMTIHNHGNARTASENNPSLLS